MQTADTIPAGNSITFFLCLDFFCVLFFSVGGGGRVKTDFRVLGDASLCLQAEF